MKSVNKVFLFGNVGRSPETRTTASGKVVTTFSLATNRRIRKDDGWSNSTDWHNVVTFDRLADRAQRGVKRGQSLAVIGMIRPSTWLTRDGEQRKKVEIIADNLCFDKALASLDGEPKVETDAEVEATLAASVQFPSDAQGALPGEAEIPF
jgi:single-strand DNA-binding protein